MVVVAIFEHGTNVLCNLLADISSIENRPFCFLPIAIPSYFTRHCILKPVGFGGCTLIVFLKSTFNEVCHFFDGKCGTLFVAV